MACQPVIARHDRNVEELMSSIQGFTNPFTEEAKKLYNIATKLVIPDSIIEDLINELKNSSLNV